MFYLLLLISLLCSCHHTPSSNSSLISMQMIDRNGFSETISSKERLEQYAQVDFFQPQPYQKVLRVFKRDEQGKSPSLLTSYHASSQIAQYLEALDGRAHGLYREWHPSGQLKLEAQVLEGLADLQESSQVSWVFEGISRVWDEEGHLLAEIPYDKGLLHGKAFYYYPSGKLKQVLPYNQNALEGESLLFDPQGNLLEKLSYHKGKRFGLSEGFWVEQEQTLPLYVEKYAEDLLLQATYWDASGKKVAEIQEGKGERAQFKDKVLYNLSTYEKGKPQGVVRFFSVEGALSSSHHLQNGLKDGEEWVYYPSGSPKLSLHWHEGILQGKVTTWYPNGAIESQKELSANKKQGLSCGWFETGELMFLEEYEEDCLLKGSYFKKGSKTPIATIEKGKGVALLYSATGHLLKKIPYDKGKPLTEKNP